MDNTLSYKPLWDDDSLGVDHQRNIDDIHVTLMNMLLPETSDETPAPTTIGKVLATSMRLANTLLSDSSNENEILQGIRATSTKLKIDPIRAIKGAITEWHLNHVERLKQRLIEIPSPEEERSIGNLGYISMLRLRDVWDPPSHPRLREAALMANATVSFLFASLLIIPHLKDKIWRKRQIQDENRAMAKFLQTTWQVARENWAKTEQPPAAEFGAMNTEVKLSRTGGQLLTVIGCDDWEEAPYWYPCRVVPGSAWNKFIKNRRQPVFPMDEEAEDKGFRFMVPNSAKSLINIYGMYYDSLRFHFDQENLQRAELSEEERALQFSRLAKATGMSYSNATPLDNELYDVEDFVQTEYMNLAPVAKKPATDLCGNLTLPFLNTTAVALRLDQEPDFAEEEDFMTMVFEN
uniref:Mating type protein 1-1-2 n=1 Tax=Calonectria pauciramosa TaxID=75811 RepID=A0A7S5WYI6_9HYPO|nr:mating type protein 1-1-2 [Calonectria pauciramosa]